MRARAWAAQTGHASSMGRRWDVSSTYRAPPVTCPLPLSCSSAREASAAGNFSPSAKSSVPSCAELCSPLTNFSQRLTMSPRRYAALPRASSMGWNSARSASLTASRASSSRRPSSAASAAACPARHERHPAVGDARRTHHAVRVHVSPERAGHDADVQLPCASIP